MNWTDERVEHLKKLWQDGLPCSKIARQLGGVTTNAVIGKVRRMGLPFRREPTVTPLHPPEGSVMYYPPSRPRLIRGCDDDAPLPARRFRAADQPCGTRACSWPIGQPDALGFSFCGNRASANGPYCSDHNSLAFQPKSPPSLDSMMRGLRRHL